MQSHAASPVSRHRLNHRFARRWSSAAWVLAGTLALAGCAASGQPGETSASDPQAPSSAGASSPPSATASALPSMVPATPTSPAKNVPVPELPEAAKEKTPQGAVAFTEFYVELMNYTWATNDVEPMLVVTEGACRVCFKGTINQAEDRAKRGVHVVGGDFVVTKISASVAGNIGTSMGTSKELAFTSHLATGAQIEKSPAVPERLTTFTLVFGDGAWKVRAIESASLGK